MGQKLGKSTRGAYDAIVYIDGSEVVAEDSQGRKIASGVAGTDDDTVRDAAISYLSSGGKLKIASGSYHWASAPAWPSGINVTGNGSATKIYVDTDIIPFNLVDISNSHVSDLDVYVCNNHNDAILQISAVSANIERDSFVNINIHCAYSTFLYKGISVRATGARYIVYCLFKDVFIQRSKDAVYITADDNAGSWINNNTFDHITPFVFVNMINFDNAGAPNTINANKFSNIKGEAGTPSKYGFKNICGSGNNFIDCMVFDWFSATDPVNIWDITENSSCTAILGGYQPDLMVNSVDDGVNTVFTLGELHDIKHTNIVTVGSFGCTYKSFKSAMDAIGGGNTTPYYVVVIGQDLTETVQTNIRPYCHVVGYGNAKITSSYAGACFYENGITNSKIENIEFVSSGASAYTAVLNIHGSCDAVEFVGCKFTNLNTGGPSNVGVVVDLHNLNGIVKFTHCEATGGRGGAGCHAWSEAVYGDGRCIYDGCIGKTEANAISYAFSSHGHGKYIGCGARVGNTNNSRGFGVLFAGAPALHNCYTFFDEYANSYSYDDANDGRFRPYSGLPYQLVKCYVQVTTANAGTTLDVGTTIGGSEIATGVDISTTGLKVFTFVRAQLPIDGYIYCTPSKTITDASFLVHYSVVRNFTTCHALFLDTTGYMTANGCDFTTPGASSAVYINNTVKNWDVSQSIFRCLDQTNDAVCAAEPISGEKIKNCTIVGTMTNVTGINGEASGSSTGTGSEQTIAHGLAAIPTGCKAWIKIEYPVGSGRYITKDIPFDATNVYPTVDNGVAFEWGIE